MEWKENVNKNKRNGVKRKSKEMEWKEKVNKWSEKKK